MNFSPGVDKIWLEAVDQEYNEWNLDSSESIRAVSPKLQNLSQMKDDCQRDIVDDSFLI